MLDHDSTGCVRWVIGCWITVDTGGGGGSVKRSKDACQNAISLPRRLQKWKGLALGSCAKVGHVVQNVTSFWAAKKEISTNCRSKYYAMIVHTSSPPHVGKTERSVRYFREMEWQCSVR